MKLDMLVNAIIKYTNGDIYRIIDIDYNNMLSSIINVNANHMLKIVEIDDIITKLESGEIEIIHDDIYIKVIKEEELNDSDREHRDRSYEIVSMILTNKNFNLYDVKQINKYIKEAAVKYSISERTVKRYLAKYFIRGQTKNALLDDYYRCGGRNKEKNLNDIKVGAPRKYDKKSGEGINVTQEIKEIFEKAIQNIYYKNGNKKLTTTYEIMISKYFRDNNGCVKNKNEIPTLYQFRYWYKNNRDIRAEISSRKGEKEYNLNIRPILGTSGQDAIYPTALFQIDSTQGDVNLVSSYNRNDVIGRPTIYIIVDVFSRMITGFYAGLENASWSGVMMAFYNCTVDKVEFCKQYGIEIKENEWNSSQLPDAILGDRGSEFTGKNIETLSNSFGVDVKNTAPYRADLKGIVENLFKLVNRQFKEFIPGAINSDIKKRGEKNPKELASLTIYEINRVIIKCILNHNNSYMNTYKRDENMIEENVKCIPTEIWEWGMKNRVGYKPKFSDDVIKLGLMPTAKARVTDRGIKFKNMYYTCNTGIEKQWFGNARSDKTWQVDICYDPRNINHIYIIKDNRRIYEICTLKDSESRYLNKSLDEVEHLIKLESGLRAENKYDNLIHNIDKNEFIESEVKSALIKNKSVENKFLKKKKNISDIRENRKIEKEHNRKSESFIIGGIKTSNESSLAITRDKNNDCAIDDIKIDSDNGKEIKSQGNKYIVKKRKNNLIEKLKKFQDEQLHE